MPRYVTLQPPDWSFDPDALAAAFTEKTKVIILNTPHNPTGKVFTRDELARIAALCQQHDVIAITDEVYDRIIFDDAVHVPLATLPGMWERTLTLNSTGKTFSMTGWKIGYAIGPAHLNAALRTVHQFSVFATATPFQEAMATAFAEAEARDYYAQLKRDYTARRDTMRAMLEGAGLPTLTAGGTFFLLADVSGFGKPDDVAACFHLIETAGVVGIPPSVFYADASRAALSSASASPRSPKPSPPPPNASPASPRQGAREGTLAGFGGHRFGTAPTEETIPARTVVVLRDAEHPGQVAAEDRASTSCAEVAAPEGFHREVRVAVRQVGAENDPLRADASWRSRRNSARRRQSSCRGDVRVVFRRRDGCTRRHCDSPCDP